MKALTVSDVLIPTILAGSKTETRRLMNPQPQWDGDVWKWCGFSWGEDVSKPEACLSASPFGKQGSLLWVRETHYRFGHWEPVPGAKTRTGLGKWRFVADTDEVLFERPAICRDGLNRKQRDTLPHWYKRIARFMPRELSRINLEVKSVGIERLCNISEESAKAEGVNVDGLTRYPGEYRTAFFRVWELLHGEGSVSCSPWVWVVKFERMS